MTEEEARQIERGQTLCSMPSAIRLHILVYNAGSREHITFSLATSDLSSIYTNVENNKPSTTGTVFLLLAFALVIFTYMDKITGEQFMSVVSLVFSFYFIKKGYETPTNSNK